MNTSMNKKYPFLSLKLANEPFEEELKQAACDVIASGWYLQGEQTCLLEQEIAALCHTRHCVAVSNGLDALRLIIRAYKEMGVLHDNDKIIVPADTFTASALAVSDNGLIPCFVDVRTDTMNLDSDLIERHITPDVKGIMPVHLYGTPSWDMKLMTVARQYKLIVIEDNAQAIGAMAAVAGFAGTRVTGSLGNAAAISFYPTKNLGALGDAGAVVTNDDELAATVRAIAHYGCDRRYHNIYRGLNCRIDELQAAMLRVKLRHLNEENKRRREVALAYNSYITHPHVTRPTIFDDMTQVWHQYVIRCSKRDKLREYLDGRDVGTDIHYATPPHCQPCYKEYNDLALPVTMTIASQAVSLPIAHPITADDAIAISSIINEFEE